MLGKDLLENSKNILQNQAETVDCRLEKLCAYLKKEVAHYDWVGFYFKHGQKRELKLRAFAGEPTDHIIIPFGKGICGQVAETNASLNVSDIEKTDNYLACGINVKSEMVVPIFLKNENIGQIDIDSHQKNAFSNEDKKFLGSINEEVAKLLH